MTVWQDLSPAAVLVTSALQTEMTLSRKSYARLSDPRDFQELMGVTMPAGTEEDVSSVREACLPRAGRHWEWESVQREASLGDRNIPPRQHRHCSPKSKLGMPTATEKAYNITILGCLLLFLFAEFQGQHQTDGWLPSWMQVQLRLFYQTVGEHNSSVSPKQ